MTDPETLRRLRGHDFTPATDEDLAAIERRVARQRYLAASALALVALALVALVPGVAEAVIVGAL